MPIDTISFDVGMYPRFQAEGNAAQFAIPFAKHVCKGTGVDIGPGRREWAFPGACIVDPAINEYHATNYPYSGLDYVFSSHCLEHVPNWVEALAYWLDSIRIGGVLFLYLPDFSQIYWRPWNNTKHLHVLTPDIIRECLRVAPVRNVFVSGVDLNNSFMVMVEKR